MLRGLGDPLSANVQCFFGIRNKANSPCAHRARPTKRELRSGQGECTRGLPAVAVLGAGLRWGRPGSRSGSPLWKHYQTTGFAWEPNLLDTGAVKVNCCYLGQTRTQGDPADRGTVDTSLAEASLMSMAVCAHTTPTPSLPVP